MPQIKWVLLELILKTVRVQKCRPAQRMANGSSRWRAGGAFKNITTYRVRANPVHARESVNRAPWVRLRRARECADCRHLCAYFLVGIRAPGVTGSSAKMGQEKQQAGCGTYGESNTLKCHPRANILFKIFSNCYWL